MRYKSIIKITLLTISSIGLSGCFLLPNAGITKFAATQKTSITEPKLSSREILWSNFIGYSPEAHAVRLSVVVENLQYLIAQQAKKISALDLNTGHRRWHANTAYALTNRSIANKKLIFVTTSEPRVLALKAATGEVAWSVVLPNIAFAAVYADEQQIIVKTIMSEVIALNAKNGKLLWRYQHSNTPPSVALHDSGAPIVYNNQVFVGFPDSKLLVLDLTNGNKIAEHTITKFKNARADFHSSQFSDVATDPVIDDGKLYIHAYQNKLQALSLANYEVLWEHVISSCKPLLIGKYAYMLDDKNNIYALNKQDGHVVWQQKALNTKQLTGPALVASQDKLVVADQEGSIYWLSTETGTILSRASFSVPSPILNTPLVRGRTVYAITRKGQIAAWTDRSTA